MLAKKLNVLVYVISIAVLLGVGFWIYRSNIKKEKTVTVERPSNFWEKSVDEFYDNAKQAGPDNNSKALADELFLIIKDTVKNDVKLSESTDKKLVFILKTILVEGDVDNIKKALENKGYKKTAIADQYKKLTAQKDGKTITFAFSVDTTSFGRVEVAF